MKLAYFLAYFFGTDKHAETSLNAYILTKEQVKHTAFCFATDRPFRPAYRSCPAQETSPLRRNRPKTGIAQK